MLAGRVDVWRVAQAKFDIDRGRDTHQFGNFIEPHKAAEVIRCLDVDIEGNINGLTNGGNLCQRQIGGNVEVIGTKPFHPANRRWVSLEHHYPYVALHLRTPRSTLPR